MTETKKEITDQEAEKAWQEFRTVAANKTSLGYSSKDFFLAGFRAGRQSIGE